MKMSKIINNINNNKMPRHKIAKESENEIDFIIDCLNDRSKQESKNEDNYRGFVKNKSGIFVNSKNYVLNFKKKVIIGKLNDRKMFEYLNDKDLEWCKEHDFSYKQFI